MARVIEERELGDLEPTDRRRRGECRLRPREGKRSFYRRRPARRSPADQFTQPPHIVAGRRSECRTSAPRASDPTARSNAVLARELGRVASTADPADNTCSKGCRLLGEELDESRGRVYGSLRSRRSRSPPLNEKATENQRQDGGGPGVEP